MSVDKEYEIAKRKVNSLKGFYEHLLSYLFVNVLLFLINLGTIIISKGNIFNLSSYWFYWVSIFWGFGLFIHAIGTFWDINLDKKFLGSEWEENKIQEYMKKK